MGNLSALGANGNMRASCIALLLAMLVAGACAQDLAGEIGSLDFKNIIGGPMNAIVDAQAQSALTTAKFISDVGLTEDENGKVMVPIPYIRVSSFTLAFACKLDSIASRSTETDTQVKASLSVKTSKLSPVQVKAKVSVSTQIKTKQTGTVKKSYSLDINVAAESAAMPAGTARILDILEAAILQRPDGGDHPVRRGRRYGASHALPLLATRRARPDWSSSCMLGTRCGTGGGSSLLSAPMRVAGTHWTLSVCTKFLLLHSSPRQSFLHSPPPSN